jgi:hypothetical protein
MVGSAAHPDVKTLSIRLLPCGDQKTTPPNRAHGSKCISRNFGIVWTPTARFRSKRRSNHSRANHSIVSSGLRVTCVLPCSNRRLSYSRMDTLFGRLRLPCASARPRHGGFGSEHRIRSSQGQVPAGQRSMVMVRWLWNRRCHADRGWGIQDTDRPTRRLSGLREIRRSTRTGRRMCCPLSRSYRRRGLGQRGMCRRTPGKSVGSAGA